MRVRFVRPEVAATQPPMASAIDIAERPRPAPQPAPRADGERDRRKTLWPWLLLLALIVIGPVMYYVAETTYRSIVVEAPGFLRQRQVVAYVPPAHSEYAVAGQQAMVTFPDGSQRIAQVVDVPDTKRLIPVPDPYDNGKIGVLVRMRFTEDPAAARQKATRLKDGLPVRVHFKPRIAGDSNVLVTQLQHAWADARDHLKQWRAQPPAPAQR